MALQSGKMGVSPKDVTLSGRVKGFDDPTLYLTKEEAALTYLTIIASNSFLTKALAETTYQTIADMVNYQLKLISGTNIKRINGEDILGSGNISVLTNEIASGIYQTIQGMSAYALKSEIPDLTNYLEKTEAPGYADILTQTLASATYMPQNRIASASTLGGIKVGNGLTIDSNGVLTATGGGDMSAYVSKAEAPGYADILTQTAALATYQTIANMSNYVAKIDAPGYSDILTQTVASATYQTIANMSNYQPLLVSGTNLKTINNQSLLGSGDISVGGNVSYGSWQTVNITASTSSGNPPTWSNVDIQVKYDTAKKNLLFNGSFLAKGGGTAETIITTDLIVPNNTGQEISIKNIVIRDKFNARLIIDTNGVVKFGVFGSVNNSDYGILPVPINIDNFV